jgi:hypothetical protein
MARVVERRELDAALAAVVSTAVVTMRVVALLLEAAAGEVALAAA